MTESNIIEKIKKLFAMANRATNNDGSSNEQEASAAMAMAQSLLAKYNLDLKTIQDATQEEGKREKTQVKRSAMYRWQQQFWKGLAEANYCWHWIVEVSEVRWNRTCRVKRHVILGSEANVAVVTLMGDYLTEVMERLCPYTGTERLSRSAISWREGCAARLIDRIQENMERMKREGVQSEGTTSTALAVQDLHEKEYAANYDARYGMGSYARMKKNEAEWAARSEERRKQQVAEQARTLVSETPAERARREKQENRQAAKQAASDARWWERHYRKEQREASRRDVAAYARGFKKANDINLDSQLKKGTKKEELQ